MSEEICVITMPNYFVYQARSLMGIHRLIHWVCNKMQQRSLPMKERRRGYYVNLFNAKVSHRRELCKKKGEELLFSP